MMKLALTLLRCRRVVTPLLAVTTLVLLAGAATSIAQTVQPATWNGLPVGEMAVDGETILVIKKTVSGDTATGVSITANQGALYVFSRKGDRGWKAGDAEGLSAAYLDEDGTIVNITDMKVSSQDTGSERPVSRILIMPYRWFAAHGIKKGTVVTAFKPVTEQRHTELAAQAPAAKKQVDDFLADEKKNLAKAAQTTDFLRLQATRKKPDIALADMREVSTPSGSLLVFTTNPSLSFAGFTRNYAGSRYDLPGKGLSPLRPNEAVLATSIGNEYHHWAISTGDEQPLSAAFMDENGRISDLQHRYSGFDHIKFRNKDSHEDGGELKAMTAYTLLAPVGWFDEHNLNVGDSITFKPVTAKRRDELYAQGMVQAEHALAQRVMEDKQQARQAAVATARRAGGDLEQLLQAGNAWNHSHLCEKEEAQGLLYVQSREADGSINAIYDLAVADIANNTVAGVRVQMKGSKNAEGGYDFTPVRTVKTSNKYTVNSIRAYGNLAELDVNLSGSACGTPEQMDAWAKVPDTFASVVMPVSVNFANRALHRADFYYKAEREATRLAASADEKQEHLGIRLVAAGRAPLPGEAATTGHLFRIDAITDNKGSRNQEQSRKVAGEYDLSQPCADTRSAYQCLHRNAVVHNDYIGGQRLQPKTGDWQNYTNKLRTDQISISYFRAATELELFNSMARAAKSEKVSWTPLDFAPQFEVASYQIQPGQPSASESQIDLRYRYARYVYLYSRVMMREQAEAFLQNYTLKVEGKQAQQRAMNADEAKVFLLGESASRSMCSDRIFTVSITPKTATHGNAAVDIDWTLLAERLEDGKPAIERRIHAAHYALNAQNGYSAKDTITFPCVTDALEQKGRAWIVSMDESIELKDVKFGADIVRVYE